MLYTAEGINSSVAISQWNDGAMRSGRQRPRGSHHRTLRHEAAAHGGTPAGAAASRTRTRCWESASARAFRRAPSPATRRIEHITVCEIEPVIPPTSTRYFAAQDYDVLHNPKTRIVYDDARHYLLTTTEKFDIIASDPLDVFVKGTAALYSQEYFEAVKRHLNPGGMFTPLRAALRERRAHRAQRAGDFLRGLPQWHALGQHHRRARLRHGVHGAGGPLKIDLDEIAAAAEPAGLRAGGAIAARDRRLLRPWICSAAIPARNPTWRRGPKAPRSTATATCACNTWRAGASTPRLEDFIYRQNAELPAAAPEHFHRLAAARAEHAQRDRGGRELAVGGRTARRRAGPGVPRPLQTGLHNRVVVIAKWRTTPRPRLPPTHRRW